MFAATDQLRDHWIAAIRDAAASMFFFGLGSEKRDGARDTDGSQRRSSLHVYISKLLLALPVVQCLPAT